MKYGKYKAWRKKATLIKMEHVGAHVALDTVIEIAYSFIVLEINQMADTDKSNCRDGNIGQECLQTTVLEDRKVLQVKKVRWSTS